MKFVWLIVAVAASLLSLFVGLQSNFNPPPGEGVQGSQEYPSLASFPLKKSGVVDPAVQAKYAILLDAESFYPLFRKEAYTQVPVASTTKMMTALLSFERYRLDDVVTISRKATLQIGSDTGLVPEEQLTVESLLYALLIQSGNDAAYSLAEQSGSVETFVGWMNQRSKEIGMHETTFKDPAGLDDEGRSTAFDLAVLAANLMQNTTARGITKLPEATITSLDGKLAHTLKSSNRLVTPELYFEGAFGIKTGFTPGAGHTLVAVAERGGHTLISVVLATFEDTKEASARESSKLLSWGFANYTWIGP